MDGREYLPSVAWSFKVSNVELLVNETEANPAVFRCRAIPFDSSEPGANMAVKGVGFYVTDNVGHVYTVTGIAPTTVDISDDFRYGVGPQTGKWAVLSKAVGDGDAPFLTPIHYRRLDRSAIDNIRRIELDILWKHRLFTYTAYASDDIGTDFTLTNNPDLHYMAVLVSPVEIINPLVSDFVGLWRKGAVPQVQADWEQVDNTEVDYIKNKPTIPLAQIQSDWGQVVDTEVDFIKNKPVIPPAQVNSDWNAVGTVAEIHNKPTIPPAQIQADWSQTNNTLADFIKNKPTFPDTSVFQIDFIFDDAGTITYPCAYPLRWTAMIHQQTNAPTLSHALNTDLTQYTNFAVTADAAGIVTLTGVWL